MVVLGLLLAAIGMMLALMIIILIALVMAALSPEIRNIIKTFITSFRR